MSRDRRYLRIAFSGVCGVVCLLLIVLWVRSYWYCDEIVALKTCVGLVRGQCALFDPNSFRRLLLGCGGMTVIHHQIMEKNSRSLHFLDSIRCSGNYEPARKEL
jgi:hypothetical protein